MSNLWTEIKEKVSLTEYLKDMNEDFPFKYKGRTTHTRCPFPEHNDSTPSFVIYDDIRYYCFGCAGRIDTKHKAQGDIFDLICAVESLSKVEVLQRLATEHGIELVGPEYEYLKARFDQSDKLKSEVTATSIRLSNNDRWMKYLSDRRKIDLNTINYFEVGVSESGSLSIPLRDDQGYVVGTTKHHPEAESKYINPVNSEWYKKDAFLYNADSLIHHLPKDNTVYITEGYFDVMSMYQAGFKTTVGLCSARLTENQVNLLRKHTNEDTRFVFVPDGDATGWATLQENFEVLRRAVPNSCYVVTFPQDPEGKLTLKDPNDWFRNERGPLPKPAPYFDSIVQYHIAQCPEDPDLQARRVNKALRTANALEKQRVIDMLSTNWSVPKDVVARFINADPFQFGEELYKDSVYRIDEYVEYVKNLDTVRMSTGFKEIDDKIRGINPGEVMGIMGRANVGKTLTITELCNNLAKSNKDTPTVIFSLEMQSTQLQERMIVQALGMKELNGVSPGRQLEEMIKTNDERAMKSLEWLKEFHKNVIVVDTPGLSVDDMDRILNDIEATKFHAPVQRVIVDHLTIIRTEGKSDYERTSIAIKAFRNMIRRRRTCCGIILIQTSRKGGTGGDPLSMDDARNSGEIEETLDFMVGCWRPELKALAEVEKLRATPLQPQAKLKKDENGRVQKDEEGRRVYESDADAQKRARQEAHRLLKLAADAAAEHRGLMYMALLKSRREGRNTIWIYRVDGLNLIFQKEAGASYDQFVADEDLEDPLEGNDVSPEDIVFPDMELPGKFKLGTPA